MHNHIICVIGFDKDLLIGWMAQNLKLFLDAYIFRKEIMLELFTIYQKIFFGMSE